MPEKKGVVIYYKYKSLLATLPAEDQGAILMASLEYDETGNRLHLRNPVAEMLFSVMVMDFDAMRTSWESKAEERSSAGKEGAARRWGKKAMPDDSKNAYKDKDKEKDKEKSGGGPDQTDLEPAGVGIQSPPPLDLIKIESAKNGFFIDKTFAGVIANSGLDPAWLSGNDNFLHFVAERIRKNKAYSGKPASELKPLFKQLVSSADDLRAEYPVWKAAQEAAREKESRDAKVSRVKADKPAICPHCGGTLKGSSDKSHLRCCSCSGFYDFDDEKGEYVFYEHVDLNFKDFLKKKPA